MGKQNTLKLLGLTIIVALIPLFIKGDYFLSVLVFMGLNSLVVMGLSLLRRATYSMSRRRLILF